MDVLTRHLQEDVPWCMLFADDILLVDKTREGVEGKLELWRSTLESKGFRLSRSKSEYMECNFSSNRPSEGIVTLGDQVINKSTRFRYLESIVQSDGEIDEDIISRIQVGWLKWRNASGLLCDRNVPLKFKGKFYKMVMRPAMLYGVECWPLKEKHNTKLSVAEMRMLRWMSGFTLRDRIRNEHIREKVGVAPVEDKIRESCLRWFGHIKRRPSDDLVRRVEVLDLTYVKKGNADAELQRGGWMIIFLQLYGKKIGLEKIYGGKAYVGLRIPDPDTSSRQHIDVVLVTKREVMVVAVRNFSGFVVVGDGGNWVCTKDKKHKPETFPDPVRLEFNGNRNLLGEFIEFKGNSEDMQALRNVNRSKVAQFIIQKPSLFGLGRSRLSILYSPRDVRGNAPSALELNDIAVKPSTEFLFQPLNSNKPCKFKLSNVASVSLSA
ncbi:hypothetical protein KFK09_018874 [Dendrobium nobile]|uniref:NERD domain-containing protein n=1 Tax=Dendrobium nobile TaxID=94219 RepID=A0A8T3AXD5_DENNO|nr:hypothetical protein KFK09_018874 [Dendrobium nobile]